ncbi:MULTISPECIES: CCA tRNA nucleotidyltransferase [Kordiimonas]|uniref:CCA tRNA nucleotidyltransferase n=1 Tax=Kordiimonas TaxID=288021 RepID=UPI00257A28A5|nr:CCA tRNA nucleotidyltransferase [Kordiimonas sp. UBA4487]
MSKIQASWLQSPFIQEIAFILGPADIRFVGGAVRDTLVGRDIKDIDAATRWRPGETMEKLQAAGIKVIPTGLDHGTVTAVRGAEVIEITTLRHDVETDGRRAVVAFTDDWLADAKRRDFTMNAIYMAVDGTLYDPFGGEADVRAGHVKFIGEASERIREDALRILRFFRFHAHYGSGLLDEAGLQAAKANVNMLERLSVERIRDELCKLLAAPNPLQCLDAMQQADIWSHTPVVDVDLNGLKRVMAAEKTLGMGADILMRLVGLVGNRAGSVGRLLKMSNRDMQTLKDFSAGFHDAVPKDAQSMRVYLYRKGRDAGQGVVMAHPEACGHELADMVANWPIPELPVRGRDLIARGMEPGPDISKALKQLEEAWVASDFKLTKEDLLRLQR